MLVLQVLLFSSEHHLSIAIAFAVNGLTEKLGNFFGISFPASENIYCRFSSFWPGMNRNVRFGQEDNTCKTLGFKLMNLGVVKVI